MPSAFLQKIRAYQELCKFRWFLSVEENVLDLSYSGQIRGSTCYYQSEIFLLIFSCIISNLFAVICSLNTPEDEPVYTYFFDTVVYLKIYIYLFTSHSILFKIFEDENCFWKKFDGFNSIWQNRHSPLQKLKTAICFYLRRIAKNGNKKKRFLHFTNLRLKYMYNPVYTGRVFDLYTYFNHRLSTTELFA